MNDFIMVYDSETSGFPNKNLGLGHRDQPKLASLAATLYRPDGSPLSSFNFIVRPDLNADGTPAWTMPEEVVKIHGISTELAMAAGVTLRVAIAAFTNMRGRAAEIVAHNRAFDEQMVEIALTYMGVKASNPWPEKRVCTCTDDGVAELVKLKPTARQKQYRPDIKYKQPNLTELHTFLFGVGFDGAHGAGADRDACARCFFELRKRGVL